MTETWAALIGALIGAGGALGGAFGVQLLIARRADKRRRQELIASFLSIQETIALLASGDVGVDPVWIGAWRDEIRDQYGRAAGVAHELGLMCDRTMANLILTSLGMSLKVWETTDQSLTDHGEKRAAAVEVLREDTRRMSEGLHDIYGT